MFSFFKRDEPKVKVSDKVWMSTEAKWEACAKMAKANANCIFVCWFEKTHQSLTEFLKARLLDTEVVLASDLSKATEAKLYIFVEHYPMWEAEQKLFTDLGLPEVNILCGLDEPLFQQFNGDRIVRLMESMGVESDEIVGHSMVSKAIGNAQKKIAEKVEIETKTLSQEAWFKVNIKPKF